MTSWGDRFSAVRDPRPAHLFPRSKRSFVSKTLIGIGLALILVSLGGAFGCRPGFDADAEKSAVTKVIEANIAWFKDKDFAALYGTYSRGTDLFMFQLDTASTIRGFAQFEEFSKGWRDPDVAYAGHRFTDLEVTLSRLGDAAWFSTVLEDCARVKDRAPRCFTSRYTGVLEKRDGRWLIVQQHFSLPAEKVAEDWPARASHPLAGGGSSPEPEELRVVRRDVP